MYTEIPRIVALHDSHVFGSVHVVQVLAYVHSPDLDDAVELFFFVMTAMARIRGLAWLYFHFMVQATSARNATTLARFGELITHRVADNVVGSGRPPWVRTRSRLLPVGECPRAVER